LLEPRPVRGLAVIQLFCAMRMYAAVYAGLMVDGLAQ
jgi:hypothetical protein